MSRRRQPLPADPDAVLGDALEALGGAAIVLDPELRVVGSTAAAARLLGFTPPRGASAPHVLCGDAHDRPVAEALAGGRPVHATIAHPGSADARRRIDVRSVPLGPARARRGWLLLLEEARLLDNDEEIFFHGMWTCDRGMKEVFRIVERVAVEDVTVLVRGETGAGKELVAHALHVLSSRRNGPLRVLNCAALPPTLLESELFGHARGAFTGAVKDTPGHVQLAHRGTLFLDEIAELPLELQAKLLRVLETGTVLPVGAREPVKVDVRVVSATHRALRKEVEANRFRADLMYRLRVIPIFIPPLRERPGDIALLARKFIEQQNEKRRRQIATIAPAALEALVAYDFPGNVRELRNALLYAFATGQGPVLLPSDLPPEVRGEAAHAAPPVARPGAAEDGEAARVRWALERAGGSKERAAEILGWSRVTLWRRLRALGLAPERGRRHDRGRTPA